jgi:hypothetical protein
VFVDSVHPAAELRVDLMGGTVCCSRDNPGIGGEGEWNLGHVVHPQACGHANRHDLDDLDGALPYDMAAEDFARRRLRVFGCAKVIAALRVLCRQSVSLGESICERYSA